MASSGRNYPYIELFLRLRNEADEAGETAKCLFQKMMRVRQPQDFTAVRKRPATQEVHRCKCFAATGGKYKDATARLSMHRLVPCLELLEGHSLMGRRDLCCPLLASRGKIIFPIKVTTSV